MEEVSEALDVSRWAEKCGSPNPDLPAFFDYAEAFFRGRLDTLAWNANL